MDLLLEGDPWRWTSPPPKSDDTQRVTTIYCMSTLTLHQTWAFIFAEPNIKNREDCPDFSRLMLRGSGFLSWSLVDCPGPLIFYERKF